MSLNRHYDVGDLVVYRKQKRSTAPGPRAKNIQPASHGDEYGYSVDKYWRVAAVNTDGTIEVVTRKAKRHSLQMQDECMRPAYWWEIFFLSGRFPTIEATKNALDQPVDLVD